jgi:hypothetical protein
MGKLTFNIKAVGTSALSDSEGDSSLLWTLVTVFVVSVFVFAGVWAITTALA